MDASALIGNAQTAYAAGLQKQAAANAAALQGTATRSPRLHPVDQNEKVRKTAQEFEAFFVGQMMEHMMAGIEPDPLFGGGTGEEMWRSMLNQEYGKHVAKSGKLGIASNVMKAMLQAQEERTAAATAQPSPAPEANPEPAAINPLPATVVAPFLPIRR